MRGNLRETLEEVVDFLETWSDQFAPTIRDEAESVIHKAKSALAAPRLNGEVGTAEEQCSRMWSYCAETRCGDTLCRNGNCSLEDIRMCALRWAQKPYLEGDAK